MEYLKLILIGMAGGTISGVLGLGGGVVMVPLLIYVVSLDIKVATAISMVQIFFASASGTLFNFLEKNIKVRTAVYFGLFSMAFSFLGSFFTKYIPDMTIKILYLVAVIASLSLFVIRSLKKKKHVDIEKEDKKRLLKVIPLGAIAGFLGGILGVGGGFLYVPVLIFFLGFPIKLAVGTSLMIILFNSVPGVIGKALAVEFDWLTAIIISIGAIGGARLGTYIKRKIRAVYIHVIFVIVLIAIIIRVILDLAGVL
jgi:uncharacterized membrane protein YfcA